MQIVVNPVVIPTTGNHQPTETHLKGNNTSEHESNIEPQTQNSAAVLHPYVTKIDANVANNVSFSSTENVTLGQLSEKRPDNTKKKKVQEITTTEEPNLDANVD